MPVKRSRIGRSSSSIDTDQLSHVFSAWEVRAAPPPSAAVKPPKCLKPFLPENSTEQLRPLPMVLTLMSPVQEGNFDAIGGFLENCYNCKKKISQNDEVFMYSDLHAFCTAGCRDSQIALDKEMEKQAATSKVVAQSEGEQCEGLVWILTGAASRSIVTVYCFKLYLFWCIAVKLLQLACTLVQ